MFIQLTIKKIISMFRYIATNHTELATFRCSEDALYNEANQDNYPQFFLEYPFSMASVNLANQSYNHNLQSCTLSFIIVDRISESLNAVTNNNFLDIDTQIENVLTKCELIAQQCLFIYDKAMLDMNITLESYSYITLHHIFSDKTYGVRVDLTFNYPNPLSFCEFSQIDDSLLLQNIFNC